MWIRSQSREVLVKTDSIEVKRENPYKSDSIYNLVGSNVLLGSFSTMDKALKELDTIQDAVFKNFSVYNVSADS
ncbi:hypothetical protein BJP46_18860 [Paenibacillus odorifer]|nr:hypothetical protein BJP46_18860 [Paenibacillus odorifer]